MRGAGEEKVPRLNRTKWIALLLSLMILMLAAGCKRDPNVRKQKYLESGNRYLTAKKYREAAIQYQNALQIDNRFADAHYKLAQAHMGLGNWTAAYLELRRAVEFNPQNLDAQADLGGFYVAGKIWAEAEKTAGAILAAQPDNPNGHSLLASVAAGQNNLPKAQEEMTKALQAAPNRVDLLIGMGRLQEQMKNSAEAEAYLKKAVQSDPTSAPARMALSELYMEQSKLDLAESNIQQGIAAAPNAILYQSYARFLLANRRLPDAERLLADAKAKLKTEPSAYRLLGEFYLATGSPDKAIGEFGQLVKDHPDDTTSWTNYVGLLMNNKRMDEAEKLINAALKKNKKNLDALILKGQFLNTNGRAKEALEILEPAVKSDPESALAQLELGDALAATGASDRAERAWREAAKLSPNLPAAHERLAKIALAKHDVQLLKSAGENLVRLQPSGSQGHLILAMAAAAQQDAKGAEEQIRQAIAVAPSSPEGYSKMGDLLTSQKKFDAANKMYEQALEKNPAFVEALVGEVRLLAAQKQPAAKIIARINAQIAKSPNTDGYWVLLAQTQAASGDLKSATSSSQKALSINSKNYTALMLFAQLATAGGNVEGAISTYDQMAMLNPTDPIPEIVVGTLEQARGNVAQAQKRFENALVIRPDDAVASNDLSYLLLENGGNKDLALSLAQTARRALPDNASVADTLGWALYQKEIYGSAREMLEEAIKKSPENANVHYHLGMTYSKTSDTAKAIQHFKKSLELAPNGPNAPAIKQYLANNKG
jgi:tetratricopeptide (TPR) repeat protein